MIRTKLPREFNSGKPPCHDNYSSYCALRAAGARAQEQGQSASTSSQTPPILPSRPVFRYAFADPSLRFGTAKSLTRPAAINLYRCFVQDRQPEIPSGLRSIGSIHRMYSSLGYFGMSPSCSVCNPCGCRRQYDPPRLFQRIGLDLGHQH